MAGEDVSLSETGAGAPPSIETRQRVVLPANNVYTTHFPSGDTWGRFSPLPLVNCSGLEPSMSMRQMCEAPERVEVKTAKRPSGETAGLLLMPAFAVSCL